MSKVSNIHKSFGDGKILSRLNLELNSGQIYSLMVANGAGRTTLFNILSGFIKKTAKLFA